MISGVERARDGSPLDFLTLFWMGGGVELPAEGRNYLREKYEIE